MSKDSAQVCRCDDYRWCTVNTGNRLGDEGFQQLIQTLSSLPHLTVLDVSSNGLTEQCLDSLASALKSPSTSTLQVYLDYLLPGSGWLGSVVVSVSDS